MSFSEQETGWKQLINYVQSSFTPLNLSIAFLGSITLKIDALMENGHHTTITEPHLTFVRSLYSLGQPSFVYVMMPNAKAALSDQTMFSSGENLLKLLFFVRRGKALESIEGERAGTLTLGKGLAHTQQ